MKSGKKKIWLSHSGLEILERCPRCFWLKYKEGINQPEEIVSRLPDRFDRVIKNYFERFRGSSELPPLIAGKVQGQLESPFQDVYFYDIDEDFGFYGKLDECLVTENKEYIPVDFKTTSSDPRARPILSAYQNQMDAYAFLLEKNKKKTAGFGYIFYFYPQESTELHNGFPMLLYIQKVQTHEEKMPEHFSKALQILKQPIPKSSLTCAFCSWYEGLSKILVAK